MADLVALLAAAVAAENTRDDAVHKWTLLPANDPNIDAARALVASTYQAASTARSAHSVAVGAPLDPAIVKAKTHGNSFDLGTEEKFYVSSEHGKLRSPRGPDGKLATKAVELSDLTGELSGKSFRTREEDRYTWTSGNTYTFGGGSDYSFANGYSVSMSLDAIEDEAFETWDGQFPYDIFAPNKEPVAGAIPHIKGHGEFYTSFDNLPAAYKVYAVLPPGALFFRAPAGEVDFEKNGVSKNIGHSYGYQLGDTYSIQLSQNTNSVTAVDQAHSFESVLFSENHSYKLLGADFYAHGVDVSMGIKGMNVGLDLTALKVDFNLYGINLGVTMGLRNYSYEAILNKTSYTATGTEYSRSYIKNKYTISKIVNDIQAVEGSITKMIDESSLASAKQMHFHGNQGVTLFGGMKDFSKEFQNTAAELAYVALEGAVKTTLAKLTGFPNPISLASYVSAQTALDTLTGPLQKWRQGEFEKLIEMGVSNADRKDIKPYNGKIKKDTAQLELKPKTASLASFDTRKAITELVLNSGKKLVEINLRPPGTELTKKKENITQKFDLAKQSYFVTNYTETDKYSLFWMTDQEGPVVDGKQMTANSAGLWTQSDAKKIAKLKLDSALHQIELAVQKDEQNSIVQILKAEPGEYSLTVNGDAGKFTLSKDAATLSVKEHGSIVIDSKGATIKAPKDILIKSEKGEIDLAAKEVKVGKSTFTDSEVKIPASSVSLGGTAHNIKIKSSGVNIESTKITMNGKAGITVNGAMIKFG